MSMLLGTTTVWPCCGVPGCGVSGSLMRPLGAALPIDDVTAIVAISQRCAHQDSRTGDLHHPQAHLVCGAIAPHDVAILTRGFEGRLVIT